MQNDQYDVSRSQLQDALARKYPDGNWEDLDSDEEEVAREMLAEELGPPPVLKYDKRPLKRPKTLTNAHLTEFAKRRGLPPPLFAWTPRFTELPSEVIEGILSLAEFNQTAKNTVIPGYIKPGKVKPIAQPHLFNAMAAVSTKFNTVVENYSEFLLKKHKVLGDQMEAETNDELCTHRATWLNAIKDKCVFCSRNVDSVKKDAEHIGGIVSSITNSPVIITPEFDRKHLQGSAFNHSILCCSRCDATHWPNPIDLGDIVHALQLPGYFVLFPPPGIVLQTGRRGGTVLFLSDQILKLRELVRSDTAKYVPSWMPEMPVCFADNMSDSVATHWIDLALKVSGDD